MKHIKRLPRNERERFRAWLIAHPEMAKRTLEQLITRNDAHDNAVTREHIKILHEVVGA
ncbi:MAG: hypothetical protein KGK17_04785 [Betaproteobacteria bacterium]|nr:hypothetical protein [Betaproteobacteria bacterium]